MTLSSGSTSASRVPSAREHLWVSRIIREDPGVETSSKRQQGAWERLRADIAEWPGDAILSHEFFAAASSEQALRMVTDLAPAEVHLVVTGRDPLGMFTASWQESIKNRETRPMAEYARYESSSSLSIWNWRTLDIHRVLERWSPAFPSERVHVLPLPGRGAARREIWDRFAQLIGVDPDSVDLTQGFPNASMGVVEAETLRRINPHLDSFVTAIDRGTYIRTFLADERLVPRGGEAYWPSDEQIEREPSAGTGGRRLHRGRGFPRDRRPRRVAGPGRAPTAATAGLGDRGEVAEVAVELSARLLHDVRDLRHERRALRHELAESQRRLADSEARTDPRSAGLPRQELARAAARAAAGPAPAGRALLHVR